MIHKRSYKTGIFLVFVIILLLTACGNSSTATWQAQYDLGMQYLTEGDYEAAIVAFTAAIEIDPNRTPAYIGRGDSYVLLGTIEENLSLAQTDYAKVLELDETVQEAYLGLSDISVLREDYDGALDILKAGLEKADETEKILERIPKTLQEYYDLAMDRLDEEDYETAITILTKIIDFINEMGTDDKTLRDLLIDAYISRGDAYANSGNTEENLAMAIADYLAALDLDESATWAYLGIVDVYLLQGDDVSASWILAYIGQGDYDSALEFLMGGNFEKAEEPEPEITVDYSAIYKSYEECSEEEQSVITMLVDAAESGDLDSLPLLSEIPEINGYYYDDGYRVHITRWYETSGYDEYHGIEGYRSYMIVSVRPQSGMGYAYYISESLDIAELNKRSNYELDYCFRETDYITCPCEDWNWNGEYTEIYIYNRVIFGNEYSGYETGSVTDNLLDGTISTTYTTPDAAYAWTRIYEDEIIVDRSGTEGEWSTQYVYYQIVTEYIKKYFWLNEAYETYDITRVYDSNDNLTAKYIRSSDGELLWYRLYSYDEDGNYLGYDQFVME